MNSNELADVRCKTCGRCLGHVIETYRHMMRTLLQQMSESSTAGELRRPNPDMAEEHLHEMCHVIVCEMLEIEKVCDKSTLMSTIITPPSEFVENFSLPLVFDFSGSSNSTQRKYGQAASTYGSASSAALAGKQQTSVQASSTSTATSTFIGDLRKQCQSVPSSYTGL